MNIHRWSSGGRRGGIGIGGTHGGRRKWSSHKKTKCLTKVLEEKRKRKKREGSHDCKSLLL
jgi:hypothetical protein